MTESHVTPSHMTEVHEVLLTGEQGQQNQTPPGCRQQVVPSGQTQQLSQWTSELFSSSAWPWTGLLSGYRRGERERVGALGSSAATFPGMGTFIHGWSSLSHVWAAWLQRKPTGQQWARSGQQTAWGTQTDRHRGSHTDIQVHTQTHTNTELDCR